MHRLTPAYSLVAAVAGIAIGVCALPGAVCAQEADRQLAARLSETFSATQRTTFSETLSGSTSETITTRGGNVRIDFEMPCPDPREIGGETTLKVRAGRFEFEAAFESDPAYRRGQQHATLRMARATSSGKATVTLATAKVEWSGGKLTGTVEGRMPYVQCAVAEDFAGEAGGKVHGEVSVAVSCGTAAASARVPITGTVARGQSNRGGTTVSTTKVQLRGDSAPPKSA